MPHLNNLYFKFRNFLSQHYPKFYSFCDTRKAFVKFMISGCFGIVNDLIFLFIFHGLFKLGIVVSTSLAFGLSFAANFTLQKLWTFRDFNQSKAFSQMFLYSLNVLIGLSANGVLMHYFVYEMGIWYMFSQILVDMILGLYNFIVYKLIIFKKDYHETNR